MVKSTWSHNIHFSFYAKTLYQNHYQNFRWQKNFREKIKEFFVGIKTDFAGKETEAKGEHVWVHTHQSLRLVLESYTFHRSEQ